MSVLIIFCIIIGLVIFEFLLTKFLGFLNTLNWSDKLPKELVGIYDEKKYKKSQNYEKAKYKFGIITSTFSFTVMVVILMVGGFGWLDDLVRSYASNEILLALFFFGIIILFQNIIGLPFSYYSNFVLEERFGFNKMTRKIFFLDMIKSLLLTAVIGGLLLTLIVWIYTIFREDFWILAWGIMTFFSIFFMMFYSSVIVPLFNKQTPLEEGKLRDAIEKFSKKVGFKLDNIYVIDGSKRSSKANAYFSGLGSKKRIVLYDTLIKDLTIKELVGVLAHEIGHYKKKHTLQMLIFATLQTGFMLYVLGLALNMPEISMALGAKVGSFHVGVLAFGILFTPISIVMSLLSSILSRKNEYEADQFAGENYDSKELKSALIKLSRNNLSNLRPHPAYEFFYYSHPTVLKRLKALDKFDK